MADSTSSGGSALDIFSGALSTYFDDLTQVKLAQSYNQTLPPAGYAIGPNGQLVAQATQTAVTPSGAAAGPGGISWVVLIGGALVAVVIVIAMRS